MRFVLASLMFFAAAVFAQQSDFRVEVGTDPADATGQIDPYANVPLGTSLSAAMHRHVSTKTTTFLTEVMRTSRTLENDVIIGPDSVTASAISHGYELLARDERSARYVLVGRLDIKTISDLQGKRLYLTQQDSPRAYLARGLLREANFSLKKLSKLTYGNTSDAGLLALQINLADATFAEETEVARWIATHPGIGTVIHTTREVPAGLALSVKKTMPLADKQALLKWVSSPAAKDVGLGHLRASNSIDKDLYSYIASLGILTPSSLIGATVVNARQVSELMAKGAIAVDTRTKKEYNAEHVTDAVFAPYAEKSLKEIDFDHNLDDFTAILKLPHDKPLIFLCNGPECWKSYKASRIALTHGFKEVYWFRGGVPEWRDQALPLSSHSS